MVFIVWIALRNNLDHFSYTVGNYTLRICDFGGRWSVTLKSRGQFKKTEGRTGQKNNGGS